MKTVYFELQEIAANLVSIMRNGYIVPNKLPPVNQARPLTIPTLAPRPLENKPVVKNSDSGSRADDMESLTAKIRTCQLCPLCQGRTKSIPGTGSMHPMVMVIGESPGADEDRLGLPFVGAAGQFLDKWLEAIGLSRYTNVFITSLVRCHSVDNHSPQPDEISACAPYLDAQIDFLKPTAMLTVGAIAASYLSGGPVQLSEIRGKFFEYRGIPWMPIYHPGAVLRDPELKRPVWENLKNFKQHFLLDGGSAT